MNWFNKIIFRFLLVTAKEIYRALKNNINTSRRIICFFRDIIDIEKLDSKYREIENITETKELLEEIKNVLHQSINSSDIYTYQVDKNNSNLIKKFRFFLLDSMEWWK